MINVCSYKTAEALMGCAIKTLDGNTEVVNLEDSLGRILAEDIVSTIPIPAFRRSTVDGYAVIAGDTYGASQSIPALFNVVGKINMGEQCDFLLARGEAVFVPTGAMLPNGADAVVMFEYTERCANELFVYKPAAIKENVVDIGEDINVGARLASRGERIAATKIGAFASQGITEVCVIKKINIAIISTGDELIHHSLVPQIGEVRDINTPLLVSLANTAYSQCAFIKRVIDNKDMLVDAIKEALNTSDIVLISGGSSVGQKDFTQQAIHTFTSDIFINGIALKPGKPTLAARVCDKLILGLPGHPMAAAMVYILLLEQPYLKLINAENTRHKIMARTTTNFPSASGRATAIPVSLHYENGEYYLTPLFSKSGLISNIAKADGYIVLQESTEGINKGEKLEVTLF